MTETMTSRERVETALSFQRPDRVPRQLWVLPGAHLNYPEFMTYLLTTYPSDIGGPAWDPPASERRRGDPHKKGTYVDEWGCVFDNLQDGVIGEVKQPLLDDWSALAGYQPPWELVGEPLRRGLARVNESCAQSDLFLFGGICPRPWERYQFLRGSENAFYDVIDQTPEFRALLAMIHDFYLQEVEAWARTDVDAINFMDDWGAQTALLIPPPLWRELFKPLYADYCRIAHEHGKRVFMHSDGFIFEIYEDLIEIGVDAINSQLFCMDIEAIGQRFSGRITFWGELSRQDLLPHGTVEQVHAAVQRVYDNLAVNGGGVIATFEAGPDARPENLEAAFQAWNAVLD